MFKSTGKLVYDNKKRRCVLLVDRGIAEFYRALIPKAQPWQIPMYPTHITVARTGIEKVSDKLWGYGSGRRVHFTYDPYVWIGKTYIFLDAFSSELEDIRENLGLPRQRMPHPVAKDYYCFHLTIANLKFDR